jgi:hypothetical protein
MNNEFYNECGIEPIDENSPRYSLYKDCLEYNRNLQNENKNKQDKRNRPAFVISGIVFAMFFGWLAYRQYKQQHTFWVWFWLVGATFSVDSAVVNAVDIAKGD